VTDDEPRCPQARPYVLREEAGAVRAWCACGRSRTQPFCDGSHAGTALRPVTTRCPEARLVAWCGCKRTKTPPFCDGSHAGL
jgi:CDGSH-type Zn-finger protein